MKQQELRVFVVDDQSVRTSLATLLENDGYTVESFVSAADYLEKAPHPGTGVSRARRAIAGARQPCTPAAEGGTRRA